MRRDGIVAIGTLIVVLVATYALATIRPNLPPTPSTPFSMETGNVPVATSTELKNEKVVMRVNGEPVTQREFEAFVEQAPEEARAFYNSPEGRPLLAQQLVKLKSLEQQAKRLGVTNDPEAQVRIKMAVDQVLAALVLQKLVAQPNDARMRAEYEKNKGQFQTVDLSHILIAYKGGQVPPKPGHPVLTEAQAMQKAQQLEQALEHGARFEQLAFQESDDVNSGKAGGQLGPVSPASLPADVQAEVSRLKEGQISNPVKSAFGIHIFKAGTKQERAYEEMKPMFTARLQRDDAEQIIANLQKTAKVQLDPKFFPQQPQRPQLTPPPPQPRRKG